MEARLETAVVVATAGRGRERLLRRTLESVAGANGARALAAVHVVENGGAGTARPVVEGFSGRLPVRYAFREEGQKALALNEALERCEAELVCFLDDDVRLDPGALRAYAEGAARYGPGHHFAGPLLPDWEEEPPAWLKPHLPPSVTGWYHGLEERYYDLPHFIGSNWAAFREDLRSVGGFRPGIGPGSPSGTVGDEMEMQQRLLDAGGRGVYLPPAEARHHVARTHCDFPWARARQRRTGRTYGLLGWHLDGASAGAAGWWRVGVLVGKTVVARGLGRDRERRVHLEMALARSFGYLEGCRMRAQAR